MTQPTWHSIGGFELCLVFLFRGVCKTWCTRDMLTASPGLSWEIPAPIPHSSPGLTLASNVLPSFTTG